MAEKARYWAGVCYPENMLEDWQDEISYLLQLPYCYCVHDKDCTTEKELRKVHVHILLAYSNTTTKKSALSVFNKLSLPGLVCCSTCENVHNIRYMYNYLIHDTDDCRKKGKFLYNVSDRITGNGFDIGCFEQIGTFEKLQMCKEIADLICEHDFSDFLMLYKYVTSNLGLEYFEILKVNSGFFERLCKGNYFSNLNKS